MYGEESFGSVIGLDVVHVGVGDELPVLFAIGCETDSSVEKNFEVGPYFREVLPTCFF